MTIGTNSFMIYSSVGKVMVLSAVVAELLICTPLEKEGKLPHYRIQLHFWKYDLMTGTAKLNVCC